MGRDPHYLDTESWDERNARMMLISESIVDAADKATCRNQPKNSKCKIIWKKSRDELVWLLTTTAILESALAQHVHENRCNLKIGECDANKILTMKKKVRYYQRAFSPWQIQRFGDIPSRDWREIVKGVEGTRLAAWHAARRMSGALTACGTIRGAISRYAKGHGCEWDEAYERVEIMDKFKRYTHKKIKRLAKEKKAKAKAKKVTER